MAISRAELEAMDRDELVEEIVGMDRRLSDLQQVVYETMKPTMDDLTDRVEELEAENKPLRERLDDSGGKDQKVADIVEYAQNRRDGQPLVKLTVPEIKGATGCSRRYAYDLMDDLPEEYDWALAKDEMRQYGELEMDTDAQGRRLGIDFEGVHSAGVDVNKFTTGTETGGESR